MELSPTLVTEIRRAITQEIYNALGLPRQGWWRKLFDGVFWLPAQRFAAKSARFDRDLAEFDLQTAARNMLSGFVEQAKIFGVDRVPQSGPLLIASNHPGAYDGLVILSALPRKDIFIVVSGVDYTRSLPTASQRLIYVTPEPGVRLLAVRQCIRHLRSGGAVLIFPSGLVDPDPALFAEPARLALHKWSGSLDAMLRHAPQTRVLVTIASGVLDESCLQSPLTRLVKQDWQRRRLAEYVQIVQQLVLGRKFGLTPRVSFAEPFRLADLSSDETLLGRAERAFTAHLSLVGNPDQTILY
jgi:hypothetical protein